MIATPWPYLQKVIDAVTDSAMEGDLEPRYPRSDGTHASSLLAMLHAKASAVTEAELKVYGALGFAWEDRVERALNVLNGDPDWPFLCVRPSEYTLDGVSCNPDIAMLSKDTGRVVQEMSIKVTWSSANGAPDTEKFDYYKDQCLTYGTPMDTMAAVLLVYFVNGDYSHQRKGSRGKPPTPIIGAWRLVWNARERLEMWQAIQNLKRERESC